MTPVTTDQTERASLAAAEGLAALGVGDTALARQKYAEAGAILEREMKAAYKGADKQLLRFLAATQYYKGGHYQKALDLANKIEARLLRKDVKTLLPQFLRDAKMRSSAGYAKGIDRAVCDAWQAGDFQRALDLFRDHPYVLKSEALAYIRGAACEELGQWRAAALFFASAVRLSHDNIDFILETVATPLRLISQNRLREASEYAHHQLELLPHPATLIGASIVAFQQAVVGNSSRRNEGFEEQSRYMNRAWEAYQRLPDAHQRHPRMRRHMAFGLAALASATIQLRDKERAKEVLERVNQIQSVTSLSSDALDLVAESTQRTIRHLRNFLETDVSPSVTGGDFANSPAGKNLVNFESYSQDSERQQAIPRMLELAT